MVSSCSFPVGLWGAIVPFIHFLDALPTELLEFIAGVRDSKVKSQRAKQPGYKVAEQRTGRPHSISSRNSFPIKIFGRTPNGPAGAAWAALRATDAFR